MRLYWVPENPVSLSVHSQPLPCWIVWKLLSSPGRKEFISVARKGLGEREDWHMEVLVVILCVDSGFPALWHIIQFVRINTIYSFLEFLKLASYCKFLVCISRGKKSLIWIIWCLQYSNLITFVAFIIWQCTETEMWHIPSPSFWGVTRSIIKSIFQSSGLQP